MNIDDYTYKNCGKIRQIYLTSYTFLMEDNLFILNSGLRIEKTFNSLNLLRAFVLTNKIDNIYMQISVEDPENDDLNSLLSGMNILKFLKLE
jgi:hypothetical protein